MARITVQDCMKKVKDRFELVVLSAERAKEQAEELGHSFIREMAFLTVHSMLHLLGYDHVDDPEGEAEMIRKQKEILDGLGITRD